MASPIPVPAPVTIAILSLKRIGLSSQAFRRAILSRYFDRFKFSDDHDARDALFNYIDNYSVLAGLDSIEIAISHADLIQLIHVNSALGDT
jgi:hypothetical protein